VQRVGCSERLLTCSSSKTPGAGNAASTTAEPEGRPAVPLAAMNLATSAAGWKAKRRGILATREEAGMPYDVPATWLFYFAISLKAISASTMA
jgi:hypothetical protein